MTTASLLGKLREHELEMDRLFVQENEDKHVKGISLKTTEHRRCQESSDSDEDTFRLMSKKFSILLRKNSNKHQSSKRYNGNKSNYFNSNKYTCFGCGDQGVIKVDCPNTENKEKTEFKKGERTCKAKKAYIAWEENDVSSSNSSSEDAEANLCLKASISSIVSSNSSTKGDSYYQILEDFKETHEETNKLALKNNKLKGLNNWLESKVKNLEEELNNSRNDFETIDLIYKSSYYECDLSFCKNCKSLKNKVFYLVKVVDKLTKGKSNFENVLP